MLAICYLDAANVRDKLVTLRLWRGTVMVKSEPTAVQALHVLGRNAPFVESNVHCAWHLQGCLV